MSVGRNHPCDCGSGRKHKHCCGAPAPPDPAELEWQRLHRLTWQLPDQFMAFSRRGHGDTPLEEAWEEFRCPIDEPADRSIHFQVFLPWFFHHWTPDPHDTEIPAEFWEDFPVSLGYLRHRGARIDPLVARWIESCLEEPFTYYDVVGVRPGWGLTLRDIIRGTTVEVIERSGSQSLEAGSIILAKAVTCGGVTVLDGCGAVAFPPLEKKGILELRRRIRKGGGVRNEALREFDLELVWHYLEVAERLLDPAPMVMRNTDGHELAFATVTYEISSARAVLQALSPLAVDSTLEELLTEARLDASGNVEHAELRWALPGKLVQGQQSYVSLGMITIEPTRVRVEVNSEERGAWFRELADELLPAGSRHLSTVIEPLEAAMSRLRDERPGEAAAEQTHDELNQRPEVQAMLADLQRAHYRDWVDMELPALDGKTPRQAMRTRDGREMVEALLTDLEQSNRRRPLPGADDIMRELRDTLAKAARTALDTARDRGEPRG